MEVSFAGGVGVEVSFAANSDVHSAVRDLETGAVVVPVNQRVRG